MVKGIGHKIGHKIEKVSSNQAGFTLLEVMIALTIFAVFAVMFVAGQSGNLTDSIQMREESTLRNLCVNKINEILNDLPELTDQLTVGKETKTFDDYPDFEYTIVYKKLKFPDLTKMMAQGDSEEQEPQEGNEGDGESKAGNANATLLKTIKDNMEKLVWQVSVTVKNKKTNFFYELSAWPYNKNAKVKFEGI